MRPQWFDSHQIPFSQMWPDDILWFPLLLQKKKFLGYFKFQGHDVILSHTLEEVEKLWERNCIYSTQELLSKTKGKTQPSHSSFKCWVFIFFILVYLCKKTQRNNNKGISCLTCKVPWSIPFQSTLKFHFCTVGNLPQVNKCAYYLQYLQTFLVCVYESCFHLWADIWQLVPLFLG